MATLREIVSDAYYQAFYSDSKKTEEILDRDYPGKTLRTLFGLSVGFLPKLLLEVPLRSIEKLLGQIYFVGPGLQAIARILFSPIYALTSPYTEVIKPIADRVSNIESTAGKGVTIVVIMLAILAVASIVTLSLFTFGTPILTAIGLGPALPFLTATIGAAATALGGLLGGSALAGGVVTAVLTTGVLSLTIGAFMESVVKVVENVVLAVNEFITNVSDSIRDFVEESKWAVQGTFINPIRGWLGKKSQYKANTKKIDSEKNNILDQNPSHTQDANRKNHLKPPPLLSKSLESHKRQADKQNDSNSSKKERVQQGNTSDQSSYAVPAAGMQSRSLHSDPRKSGARAELLKQQTEEEQGPETTPKTQ